MKLRTVTKPIYAQCNICWKKYDMTEWGVECPSCKSDNYIKDKRKLR